MVFIIIGIAVQAHHAARSHGEIVCIWNRPIISALAWAKDWCLVINVAGFRSNLGFLRTSFTKWRRNRKLKRKRNRGRRRIKRRRHTMSTWVHMCIFARIPSQIPVIFLTGHWLVPIVATPTLTNWESDRRSNQSKNKGSNQSVGLPPNRPTDGKLLSIGRSVGQSEIQRRGKCWLERTDQ